MPIAKRFGLAAAAQLERPAPKDPGLAIRDVSIHPVAEPDSRRVHVILKITTAGGTAGYGEAGGIPPSTDSVGRLKALLAGMDAHAYITVDEHLRRSAIPVEFPGARAAVNMALLDILGKTTGAPIHEVLGGRTRDKVRAMAVLSGSAPEALRDEVQRARDMGYRAFSVPLRIPDGPTRGRAFFQDTRKLMDSLRGAAGDSSDFVLDCGGRTTPGEGLSLAAVMEDYHLLWLDEPAGDLSDQALAQVSEGAVTPVGYGRTFSENGRFQDLLRLDAVDVLRPSMTQAGVVEARKAGTLAETYYVAVAPYHRHGPIATAAALQLAAAMPNFFIQEVPLASDKDRQMRDAVAGASIEKPEEGFFALPKGPGLGITVNEDAVQRYQSTARGVSA